MDADRSSPPDRDPWTTGRRRPGRPDRGRRALSAPAAHELERRPADPPRADDPGTRSSAGPPSADPPVPEPGAGSPEDPWRHWRRLRPRTVRGASALGLLGTAVVLLPFLDDPDRWWVPVGLGFVTLVLLTLLRLDRLLNGGAPHVAGAVLVAGLVYGTARNPWAWGFALSAGVIVAGLLRLPRRRLLAAGTVLLVLSGIGYTFRAMEIRENQARIDAQAGAQMRTALGVDRPQLALVALDTGVTAGNASRVCRVAQDPAIEQLRAATGAATCEDAVTVLHGRLPAGAEVTRPDRESDPDVAPGGTTTVDGCSSAWGAAAGPQLGRVVLTRTDAAKPTFQVSSFAPC